MLNWNSLEEENAYSFGVISVDIVGHSKWKDPDIFQQETKKNLHKYLKSLAERYSMREIFWAGDGGSFFYPIFNLKKDYDLIVNCAICFLNSLNTFNKDTSLNKLKNPIDLRINCHVGQIIYTNNKSDLHGSALNYILKYEKEIGAENTVTITDDVYKNIIDDNLKKHFEEIPSHDYSIGNEKFTKKLYRYGNSAPKNPEKQPEKPIFLTKLKWKFLIFAVSAVILIIIIVYSIIPNSIVVFRNFDGNNSQEEILSISNEHLQRVIHQASPPPDDPISYNFAKIPPVKGRNHWHSSWMGAGEGDLVDNVLVIDITQKDWRGRIPIDDSLPRTNKDKNCIKLTWKHTDKGWWRAVIAGKEGHPTKEKEEWPRHDLTKYNYLQFRVKAYSAQINSPLSAQIKFPFHSQYICNN